MPRRTRRSIQLGPGRDDRRPSYHRDYRGHDGRRAPVEDPQSHRTASAWNMHWHSSAPRRRTGQANSQRIGNEKHLVHCAWPGPSGGCAVRRSSTKTCYLPEPTTSPCQRRSVNVEFLKTVSRATLNSGQSRKQHLRRSPGLMGRQAENRSPQQRGVSGVPRNQNRPHKLAPDALERFAASLDFLQAPRLEPGLLRPRKGRNLFGLETH